MNRVFVHGLGAVSPAGWGVSLLCASLRKGEPIPLEPLQRPGWYKPLLVRPTPSPSARPAFLSHPRLRRASPIAQHTVAATLEALGEDTNAVQSGSMRLGIIVCMMAGCVNYSRRFCEETFKDPATASPLIFPETVFNAPASHLAAFLGSAVISYTLIGDESCFLLGLALAGQWLADGRAEGCVVVGSEEMDWIVADALRILQPGTYHGDGAGALYLRGDQPAAPTVELERITDAIPFTQDQDRTTAARKMRMQLLPTGSNQALCLSTQGLRRMDAAEEAAWSDLPDLRMCPKKILGEAFTASAAWQSVWACDAVRSGSFSSVDVSVVGTNQAAIGARFTDPHSQNPK